MLTTDARYILFAAVITTLLSFNASFELPFLQSCTIEDEKCHIEQVDKFFEMYANGIKELDVAPLDPMPVGDIKINGNNNTNFNMQLIMKNAVLYKYPILKCLGIKGFTKDPTKPIRLDLKMLSPQLIIKTHCTINGKLLIFTVAGDTDLTIEIKNITTYMKIFSVPYTKDGRTYYKVEDMKPKLEIGSLAVSFANSTLFNGEEIFMKTFEDTINQNYEVLRDEVEPHLSAAIAKVEIDILNKILATMPYDKFFKESKRL